MAAPVNELPPLLDHALNAAFAAGSAIMAVYGNGPTVRHKADNSPVTEADLDADAAIRRALLPTALPVLSEEGETVPVAERQAWTRYWLVDPLDGTKEFVKRNGEFTVNIALMERDGLPMSSLGTSTPLAGVLYAPVADVLYFAWNGGGAYRLREGRTFAGRPAYELAALGERLPMTDDRSVYTIATSRSHLSPDTEAFIRRKREEHGQVARVDVGSALKICLVAEGTADVYPRYAPTMEWDTAAGHAIALEAGKDLVDVTTGERMRYNKQELMNQWFIVE
ncbi:MAG: 3'(2'),5'-bisphosphate nucleotidase CysQ [Flavobacteriales bacterium]